MNKVEKNKQQLLNKLNKQKRIKEINQRMYYSSILKDNCVDIEEIKIIYKKSPRIVLGFIIGPRIVLGFIIGVRTIFMVLFLTMAALHIYPINVIYINLVTYLTNHKIYLI